MAKKEKLSLEELLEQALVKDEDKPYAVPGNWIWTRLDSIGNVKGGKRLPRGHSLQDIPTSHAYIRVVDFNNGCIDGSDIKFITDETHSLIKIYTISKDDIYISIAGTIGKVGIVPDFLDGANLTENAAKIVINKIVAQKYLCYLLECDDIQIQIKSSTIATTQAKLALFRIGALSLPLPPLPEQQRIVGLIESLFEKLDRAKELAQNALDSFENRKSAILHKAFTGELTRKWREENEGNEWANCILNDIILEKPRNGYSPNGVPYVTKYKNLSLSATTTGVFKSECFKYVDIDIDDNSYLWLKNGDILIQRSNSLDYVGTCAIYDGQDNEYIYPDLMMKIQVNAVLVITKFLYYILSDIDTKKYYRDNATGTSGNMPKINQKIVMNTPIPFPTMAEQKEIVRILDNLLVNEQKAKEFCGVIDKIDHMKKAILARAFRGELSTNNPDEESALELLKEVLKEKV